MADPAVLVAPSGVRAIEHRLDGGSSIRAEKGASHSIGEGDPIEVGIGTGALWVHVPARGARVRVVHGGVSALIGSGSLMVDAGEGRDALLVVISGEVQLVDAVGTTRVLTTGDAAVVGAAGDLAGVDQVDEDELTADPWAVANQAWDDALRGLDHLYAAPEFEEVSGRGVAHLIEIAVLVLLIGTALAILLLFNHSGEGDSETTSAIPAPASTTSTSIRTTTTEPAPPTTTLPSTVKVTVDFCTKRGAALVAQGTIEGAPATSAGYRITVQVEDGAKVFGSKTITVERTADGGAVQWVAPIPVRGDPVAADAECKIRAEDGVRLI